jgi:glutamate racemase
VAEVTSRHAPIGVFDSGVGGLTVLRALRERLPHEPLLYLGDTARLPYGSKSAATVVRYAEQAARVLVARGVKLLVIACNTASAVALEHLSEVFGPLPVIGVVEPGAEAACLASRSGEIVVIATEGTVRGGAYERAIHALRPEARVVQTPCPLFVALAEEGWTGGPIAEAIAHRYLDGVLARHPDADCMVLGCTHFPVLRAAISAAVGPRLTLVYSAETTARVVAAELAARDLLIAPAPADGLPGPAIRQVRSPGHATSITGTTRFLATDAPARFARVGAVFMGEALAPELRVDAVELVDL